MTEPALPQAPEGISSRAIGWIAVAVVAISAGLVAIAWLLVVPVPAARPAGAPSPLERGAIDVASGGEQIRAAGARELERAAWLDRSAGIVRIPIDLAIEAVVADPRLIGTPPAGLAQAPEAPR